MKFHQLKNPRSKINNNNLLIIITSDFYRTLEVLFKFNAIILYNNNIAMQ